PPPGPDICGPGTKKVHVIFNYKGKNVLINKDIRCKVGVGGPAAPPGGIWGDWDKPEHIPDPDAKKPEDWDEEMDGEWEPPVIQNPEYKGEWRPQQIDNPDYKGKWVHPEIDNPEYSPDPLLYSYDSFGVIGLDLWQVR
ncbi:CALR protein, partial [Sakesphorus luctuosus]|nr:CALR protein [Sakesphorus luctuosus]